MGLVVGVVVVWWWWWWWWWWCSAHQHTGCPLRCWGSRTRHGHGHDRPWTPPLPHHRCPRVRPRQGAPLGRMARGTQRPGHQCRWRKGCGDGLHHQPLQRGPGRGDFEQRRQRRLHWTRGSRPQPQPQPQPLPPHFQALPLSLPLLSHWLHQDHHGAHWSTRPPPAGSRTLRPPPPHHCPLYHLPRRHYPRGWRPL